MKIKSYFAPSVEAAVARARTELGPDALILNSHQASPEAGYAGQYEVVFAAPEAAGTETEPGQSPAPGPRESVVRELSALREQVNELRRMMSRAGASGTVRLFSTRHAKEACSLLLEEDFPADLVQRMAESIENTANLHARSGQAQAELNVRQCIEDLVRESLRLDPGIGVPGAGRRVAAFVGPCGAGKTTTLVKLALRYGPGCRKPIQVLSTDTLRIAASEQLRLCAAAIGVGFQCVDTVAELARSLQEHRNKDMILIDTPGLGCGDIDMATDLARYLAEEPEIDVQLVLPAHAKAADLAAAYHRFRVFSPDRLIFTKMDETQTFGPVVAQAITSGKPISFLADGQRIPEDLEPADIDVLLRLSITGKSQAGVSAA